MQAEFSVFSHFRADFARTTTNSLIIPVFPRIHTALEGKKLIRHPRNRGKILLTPDMPDGIFHQYFYISPKSKMPLNHIR